MQYRTLITIQPAVRHLVDALAEWLPLEVDAAEMTRLLEDPAADAMEAKQYQLSASGHVSLRADVDECEPESAWLQFDGNRRNLKAARKLVETFKLAYGPGASHREPEESLTIFRARLVDIDKTR